MVLKDKKYMNVLCKVFVFILGGICVFFIAMMILLYSAIFLDTQKINNRAEKPIILNKNSQGEYRLVVKLGESEATTYQRNPHYFEVGESGVGSAFMYPVLPFAEIPKTSVEILDEDDELAFNINGMRDIRFVNESYPDVQVGHFLAHPPIIERCDDGTISNMETSCNKSKQIFEQYFALTQVLKKYGWRVYIAPDEPRVLGQKSWTDPETLKGDYYVVRDGYYIDSYEKWKKYVRRDDIFVIFYRKNLIMEVSINGGIASHITIATNNFEYVMRYDEYTRGEKWKQYLAADIPKWAKRRQEVEAELRAKGYTIVEDYIDAPLPKEFYQK